MKLPYNDTFQQSIYNYLIDLSNENGIYASGKDDVYGCIFGRDSAITILKFLKIYKENKFKDNIKRKELLNISKRALLTLVRLQGSVTNIESGEEPGKFIHEYRPDNYDRLLQLEKPWYIYPDGVLRNYDSLDSTPLTLIALYKYWEISRDEEFLVSVLPSVETGLNWIITYGDSDKDYLLEYNLKTERRHGGLSVQSWTDSHESMTDIDGVFPRYPIAPVEVQGYAWLALNLWADFYADTKVNYLSTKRFSKALRLHAEALKRQFNKMFIFKEDNYYYAAQALDGKKNKIRTITGNPLLLLWAAYKKGNKITSIIDKKYIKHIVQRAFFSDMFDKDAGIRTMSTKSATYISGNNSYHNGSFWPKLNGLSHEGLVNFGFYKKANDLMHATLKPIEYFGSPIELYIKSEDGHYELFKNPQGQESCKIQAWSAASALDLLTCNTPGLSQQ